MTLAAAGALDGIEAPPHPPPLALWAVGMYLCDIKVANLCKGLY